MKKAISLLLCSAIFCQLIVNIGAVEDDSDSLTPPPELIILEGEEWIPGAVDPASISIIGADDDCRHNGGSPSNYRYIGAVKGNTTGDTVAVNVFTGVIAVWFPVFGYACDVVSAINDIFPGDKLQGDYVKYQYIYNVGPDPNMYWYHYIFNIATPKEEYVGSACYATYSPKKTGSDPFQD